MTPLVANPGVLGVKQQFFVCLLLERNPGPEPRQHLAELRRMCNSQHEIDPIITLYPEALTMALVRVHAFDTLMIMTERALKDGSHG